jgi:hypothetical protein
MPRTAKRAHITGPKIVGRGKVKRGSVNEELISAKLA